METGRKRYTLFWAYPPRSAAKDNSAPTNGTSGAESNRDDRRSSLPQALDGYTSSRQAPFRSATLALDKAVLTQNAYSTLNSVRKDSLDAAEGRGRQARRTKTVQEVWFGPDSPSQNHDQDEDLTAAETNPNLVKDGERELTLEWAKGVCAYVESLSNVKISAEIVSNDSYRSQSAATNQPARTPQLGSNGGPLGMGALSTSYLGGLSAGPGPGTAGVGPSTTKPKLPSVGAVHLEPSSYTTHLPRRFLFRFEGGYDKVLFAKSALRREVIPEAKAAVNFPLTHIYALSALFPSVSPVSATFPSSPSTGLSPNSIIPEVRAKLNEIAMKTGVLLTIDDPVIRRWSQVARTGAGKQGSGSAGATSTSGSSGNGVWHAEPNRRDRSESSTRQGPKRAQSLREETQVHQEPEAAGNGVVMDSPESMHMELPNLKTDVAGVIGERPGSRKGSLDQPVRSATASRFFPIPSPGIDRGSNGSIPPTSASPTSHHFLTGPPQTAEEHINQTFDSLGFIREGSCVIVIQGHPQSVSSAKTLLLVLSDELNGLHVEPINVSERLQRILAGRKNGAINHIMGVTETNIYIPEGRFVPIEEQASYGTMSPVMSPPLKMAPLLGGTSSPSIGLGSGFGETGLGMTGIPNMGSDNHGTGKGIFGQAVSDLGLGLGAMSLLSGGSNTENSPPRVTDTLPSMPPGAAGWTSPPQRGLAPGISNETVYITGTSAVRVMQAKEWLLRLAFEKNAVVTHFQSPIAPRKLDWLIHERADEIRRAMYDNGCTVRLLPGSQVGIVQVLGDHEVSIRRTMKHITKLVTGTCHAATWMVGTANVTQKYDTEAEARRLAIETDVETAASEGCVEIFSGQAGISGIRRIFDILENPTSMGYAVQVGFQVQPLIEHQDFLAGKGMGKIVSMARKSNAKIQLHAASDRLFTVDIRSDSIASVSIALGMLQEELPAETSFYLPEGFHRKIIGRNGKNIQEIMYAHKVAVRFSSQEQWAEFGGHENNEDNVLIITPAKNADVIPNVKEIVMEHVPEESRYWERRFVLPIPRVYHAHISANPAITQMQTSFGAAIRCLPRENGVDAIEVYSPRSKLPLIEPILRSLVPLERLVLVRSNVHTQDLPDWPSCIQHVLDNTAITIKLSSMFKDNRIVGITFSSSIRDIARFEAAKGIVEKFFAERQRVEMSTSFSPWGNDVAGTNSIVFNRAGTESPVLHENRNFRALAKNGKTGSLDPSMASDWMDRTSNTSPFETIPEEIARPKGLAQRLRNTASRTQSLDLKTVGATPGSGGIAHYIPSPSPTSSQFGTIQSPPIVSGNGYGYGFGYQRYPGNPNTQQG